MTDILTDIEAKPTIIEKPPRTHLISVFRYLAVPVLSPASMGSKRKHDENFRPKVSSMPDDESIYIRMSDIPFDLMRFSISAKSGAERREARKALLLKMGATPPKREYKNYKRLMQERAQQKAEAAMLPVDTASTMVNKRVPLHMIKRKKKLKGKNKVSATGKRGKLSKNLKSSKRKKAKK
ncbi:unnamed protein product [Dicrocoelium dendriticum]|nr:unnamed protein product [Dicrocoelium dendriticum]